MEDRQHYHMYIQRVTPPPLRWEDVRYYDRALARVGFAFGIPTDRPERDSPQGIVLARYCGRSLRLARALLAANGLAIVEAILIPQGQDERNA